LGAPSQRSTTVALTRFGSKRFALAAEVEPPGFHQSHGRSRIRTTVVFRSSTVVFFPEPWVTRSIRSWYVQPSSAFPCAASASARRAISRASTVIVMVDLAGM
jgi:hypothetical protein